MTSSIQKAMKEVCIVSMARTPTGGFGGAYKHLTAVQLGIAATKAALQRSNIPADKVEDVYFGNVLSAGLGQAPAKQVSLGSGISPSVPCTTVNKVCASGMKAIEIAAQNIALGQASVVVAGGFESMSNVPHYALHTRFRPKPYGRKFGDIDAAKDRDLADLTKVGDGMLIDGLARDGLSDPYSDFAAMGTFGVLCAVQNNITRQEQDAFTFRSYQNAVTALKKNKFRHEIAIVEGVELAGDEEALSRGEQMTLEKLRSLRGAFALPKNYEQHTKDQFEQGYTDAEFEEIKQSVTAGSSSTMSDGASAVVLASRDFCERNKVPYLAVIRGWGQAAQIPERFTSSPALAAEKALQMAGISVDDVSFFEVNEAFSVVPIITARQLKIKDWESKMNIYGGACSLGHALGSSGSRITITMLSAMINEGGKYGCAAICNGGGGASAIVLELAQGAAKL